MDEEVAQQILDSPASALRVFQDIDWYNSTALPYEEGVRKGDKRLLGKKIAVIEAYGTLSAKVKSHSAEMCRLRNVKNDTSEEDVLRDDVEMDWSGKKDEL
jgi:alpha-galactosidase